MIKDRKTRVITPVPAHDLALGQQGFFEMDRGGKMRDHVPAGRKSNGKKQPRIEKREQE